MRSYAMPQASAVQLTPLIPGVANSECVPWQQVQGFLDMAESALRAKNAANTILLQEKAYAAQTLAQQSDRSHQEAVPSQAEDTAFLRQQLEALLRERAASKELIAGLQRDKGFLLDERELLFQELQNLDLAPQVTTAEPVKSERQRVYRRSMTVGRWSHRNLGDDTPTREGFGASQVDGRQLFAMEPATPPDSSQNAITREQEEADTPCAENNDVPKRSGTTLPGTDEHQQIDTSISAMNPGRIWAHSPLQAKPDPEQALPQCRTCLKGTVAGQQYTFC